MKTGMYFDFEEGDIQIRGNGTIRKADIGNQICALISCSQVCRITRPEYGYSLLSKLNEVQNVRTSKYLKDAKRMVEEDGGRNVSVDLIGNDIQFLATYD